jgi:hypothetical protein
LKDYPAPVKIKGFDLIAERNTHFRLKGVYYGLSPYFSSVWGSETMPYIINQVLLMKAYISIFSHFVYIILPSKFFVLI